MKFAVALGNLSFCVPRNFQLCDYKISSVVLMKVNYISTLHDFLFSLL